MAHPQQPSSDHADTLRGWLWTITRDILVISGWVLLMTFFFLSVGWPRWAFYLLLIGGVVLYVRATGR